MGIHATAAARIRDYANGAQAMAALAASRNHRERAIGCTQVTEILYTPGVTLVGVLPPPFELTTLYSVAVSSQSGDPERPRGGPARRARLGRGAPAPAPGGAGRGKRLRATLTSSTAAAPRRGWSCVFASMGGLCATCCDGRGLRGPRS